MTGVQTCALPIYELYEKFAIAGIDVLEGGNLLNLDLDLNDKEYKIDLLLYHRGLQSLVAIDLKIGEFEPEHTGKMSFYLSLLDSQIKKAYENPSIGIIICKSKDQTTVEFALRDVNKPIGVATYSITKTLPQELSAFFPTSDELIKRVEAVIKAVSG